MRNEVMEILTVTRLPGRMTSEQAAPVLGFMPHDIVILCRAKLLKALGSPAANAVKYFASAEILRCSLDEAWLGKATKAIYQYWEAQNKKRSAKRGHAEPILKAA